MLRTKRKKHIPTKPVSNEIAKEILRKGVYTGSRVFGGFVNDKSDIDLILPPNFKYSNFDLLKQGAVYNKKYNHGNYFSLYVKIKSKKHIYNLLLMGNSTIYNRWRIATIILKGLRRNSEAIKNSLKTKKDRVKIFESILHMLKVCEETSWRWKNDSLQKAQTGQFGEDFWK